MATVAEKLAARAQGTTVVTVHDPAPPPLSTINPNDTQARVRAKLAAREAEQRAAKADAEKPAPKPKAETPREPEKQTRRDPRV